MSIKLNIPVHLLYWYFHKNQCLNIKNMLYNTYIDYHGAPCNFPVCPCVKTTLGSSLCEWMLFSTKRLFYSERTIYFLQDGYNACFILHHNVGPDPYINSTLRQQSTCIHVNTLVHSILTARQLIFPLTHWRCMHIETATNCVFFSLTRPRIETTIFSTQHSKSTS
jgi:hypothetical protein